MQAAVPGVGLQLPRVVALERGLQHGDTALRRLLGLLVQFPVVLAFLGREAQAETVGLGAGQAVHRRQVEAVGEEVLAFEGLVVRLDEICAEFVVVLVVGEYVLLPRADDMRPQGMVRAGQRGMDGGEPGAVQPVDLRIGHGVERDSMHLQRRRVIASFGHDNGLADLLAVGQLGSVADFLGIHSVIEHACASWFSAGGQAPPSIPVAWHAG